MQPTIEEIRYDARQALQRARGIIENEVEYGTSLANRAYLHLDETSQLAIVDALVALDVAIQTIIDKDIEEQANE